MFRKLLYDKGQQWVKDQLTGYDLFIQLRNDYINTCIWLVRECRNFAGFRKRNWYDAALWLLEVGSIELQDEFLRAEDGERNAWISCILADGGFHDESGKWFPLPELP